MVIIKYAIEDAVGVTRCLSVGSSSGICVSKSAGFATASVARGVRRYGPTGDIREASGRQLRRPFGFMRLCREQARSLARVGYHPARDARASRLEHAGTIGRWTKTIDQSEDLSLQIIHLRSASASTPQSSPARVASQNYRSCPIPNSSLGLRPITIMSTDASSSAFRVKFGPGPKTGFAAQRLTQRGA
jgi:hypothetical protein